MKARTLIETMEEEKYQNMTCAQFAKIVRRSKVLEEDLEIYDPLDDEIRIVDMIDPSMNAAIAEFTEKEWCIE